jgi:hypothetical protein
MGSSSDKVPAIVAVAILSFVLGGGAGVVGGSLYEQMKTPKLKPAPTERAEIIRERERNQASHARHRIATLVNKLDRLMDKPLSIELTKDERAQLKEKLQGIEDIKDEAANAKLGEIKKVLEAHKGTLEEAGFPWSPNWPVLAPDAPDQGPLPKVITDGENGKHLKALQDRLSK